MQVERVVLIRALSREKNIEKRFYKMVVSDAAHRAGFLVRVTAESKRYIGASLVDVHDIRVAAFAGKARLAARKRGEQIELVKGSYLDVVDIEAFFAEAAGDLVTVLS